jgi:hypothetical protein
VRRLIAAVIVLLLWVGVAHAQPTRPVTSERFDDYLKAHEQRHTLETIAVDIARQSIEFRLGEMNNLRAQINMERGQFATRMEFQTRSQAVDDRLNKIEQSLASMQSANLTWIAALGVFFTVVQIGLRFLPAMQPKAKER